MPNITRLTPFRSLERPSGLDEMERMLESMLRHPLTGGLHPLGDIPIDVSEEADRYTVRADMPGLSKDDINVSIDGNQISISAEVKETKEVQGGNVLCRERFCGRQFRSFTLHSPVDEAKADAKYENGVLELTLPKKGGSTKHQVKVH